MAEPQTEKTHSTDLTLVPVTRQAGVPLAVMALILVAGVIAAVVDPPDVDRWWKIALAIALVVVPAGLTLWALGASRRAWRSAAAAPMWAREEEAGATIMRFKWTIAVAILAVALAAFTGTLPTLALVALGIVIGLGVHLVRAIGWQNANNRRLFNETATAADPQGARAYWTPRA